MTDSAEKPSIPSAPAAKPKPRSRSRIIRFCVLTWLLLGLLALLAEGLLRLTMPELRRFHQAPGMTGGLPAPMNSRGMREREFPDAKPPGQLRILCAGDSTTFGLSVANEHTWPGHMQRILRQSTDLDVFVINTGGPGGHPQITLQLYREWLKDIEIDRFVLGFCMNDVQPPATGLDQDEYRKGLEASRWERLKSRTEHLRAKLARSYLFSWLQMLAKRLDRTEQSGEHIVAATPSWFHSLGLNPGAEAAWRATLDAIDELQAELDARGIPLAIVTIPYRFMLTGDPRDNEHDFPRPPFPIDPHERLRRFCGKRAIDLIDGLKSLQAARDDMLAGGRPYDPLFIDITQDYCHPNEAGYAEIAAAVAESIRPLHGRPAKSAPK